MNEFCIKEMQRNAGPTDESMLLDEWVLYQIYFIKDGMKDKSSPEDSMIMSSNPGEPSDKLGDNEEKADENANYIGYGESCSSEGMQIQYLGTEEQANENANDLVSGDTNGNSEDMHIRSLDAGGKADENGNDIRNGEAGSSTDMDIQDLNAAQYAVAFDQMIQEVSTEFWDLWLLGQ